MYKIARGTRSTSTRDGTVVLDIEHGQIFRLNSTGALIFACLKEGRKPAEIVKEISEQIRVAPETAARDVGDFLQTLEQLHLICRDRSEKKL